MGLPRKSSLKKINISRQSLSKWELGTSTPDTENILKLSRVFNVSTDYLHGHTNDKFTLTNDDKIDIKNSLEKIKSELSTDETILFDGEPMCPEAIESLLAAMEIGLSLVKQRQKKDKNI